LAILHKAWQIATTAPCGPVSVEIPIDVQAMMVPRAEPMTPPQPIAPPPLDQAGLATLAARLKTAKRPLLWLGGGARHAGPAVQRFVDKGWGVVSSVQGRGIVDERHPQSLGSFNLQKPIETFYQTVDALLVVGSRLRSNETLTYKLNLPHSLYRIDIDPQACDRAYENLQFIQGDAQLCLDVLADLLGDDLNIDPSFHADLQAARAQAMSTMDHGLGPYAALREAIEAVAGADIWWVRDITLSNTMWGNRRPALNHPRAGVHALGGGIGQGLAMGIGVALASQAHELNRKTWVLSGDGGFMLNVGELSCAAQENANLVLVLMNDAQYGVIRNIQDAVYGERHCYVDLHNPQFSQLCQSMGVKHWLLRDPASAQAILTQANATPGPCVVEVDMATWGAFTAKFAGPPKKV
jgi:acetolactate synthase-1/2/3 large subunit